MRHHHRPHCGCGCHKPVKQCVYPVKENVVHNCTEETVQHVHPSHTTVKNHHIIKNEHVYPHSTSVENSTECVDINCGGKDRKSTRLNSSHVAISYAVFCLKKQT